MQLDSRSPAVHVNEYQYIIRAYIHPEVPREGGPCTPPSPLHWALPHRHPMPFVFFCFDYGNNREQLFDLLPPEDGT